MPEWMKVFFTIVFSALLLLVWGVQMIALRDGPAEISLMECMRISGLLILFWIMYQPGIREIKKIMIHIALLIYPFVLWLISLVTALTDNIHPYDTLISAIGFGVVLLSLIQLIYLKVKDKAKSDSIDKIIIK